MIRHRKYGWSLNPATIANGTGRQPPSFRHKLFDVSNRVRIISLPKGRIRLAAQDTALSRRRSRVRIPHAPPIAFFLSPLQAVSSPLFRTYFIANPCSHKNCALGSYVLPKSCNGWPMAPGRNESTQKALNKNVGSFLFH